MNAPPLLEAQIVTQLGALHLDVGLSLGPETVALVGPNGSGKTSVLKVLLGALPLTAGRITLRERALADTQSGVHVPIEDRHIGYLPQEYGLFPHMTAEQHLEFSLKSRGGNRYRDADARRTHVATTLENLNLYRIRHRRPKELSGGERQRVALGRALIAEPKALLLDEPLAALDAVSRHEVREFLRTYLARLTLPTLFVTHDAEDARACATRILVLEQGKIVQAGTWRELEHNPATDFVAWFTKTRQPE
jgi:molybdate transport system ATP-binding protein